MTPNPLRSAACTSLLRRTRDQTGGAPGRRGILRQDASRFRLAWIAANSATGPDQQTCCHRLPEAELFLADKADIVAWESGRAGTGGAMARKWAYRLVLAGLLLGAGAPAWADAFDDAEAFYVKAEYATALRLLKPLADRGDARAQRLLAEMYRAGDGVRQSDLEALRWYRKAADQGHPKAQFGLGLMYFHGLGVGPDFREAARWYRKAADQGFPKAQFALGALYSDGQGVPQDDQKAAAWTLKAAEQNDAGAQLNLGVMYENGRGVRQDDTEAARWYRAAAERGRSWAQISLSRLYAEGRGVPKDLPEAYFWLTLSLLDLKSGRERDKVSSDLTALRARIGPDEATQVQRRVETFKAKP
jgi:uncharacterized protein